jgi:hypothetical protein
VKGGVAGRLLFVLVAVLRLFRDVFRPGTARGTACSRDKTITAQSGSPSRDDQRST